MIKIICIGKIKEKFLRDAISEYEKRLQKYVKLETIELPDYAVDNHREKEGLNILKHIKEKDYVITLEIEGENLTSIEFAKKLDAIQMQHPDIVFVIGGSDGLSSDVKNRSNYRISFSKLTFPHQLFRVILLEQIYRAFKIQNNESYHK